VDGLLARFAAHDIAATWAIVGRLLDRDDAAARSTKHGDRIWYAPQLIDKIRASRVPQDIGSHSYAHVYFGESSRDAIREDLAAARRVHDAHGLPFASFVFPRNQVAHVDLLREAGVRVFRSVDRGWHIHARQRLGRIAGRIANLVDKVVPLAPAIVEPIRHGDVVELPSSMLVLGRNGLRRAVRPQLVVAKARRGLETARDRGGTFHLWFHPSNFYYSTTTQLDVLGRICAIAAAMRDRGELAIRPMSSYA
jgi:sugar phosphate isomerase/epimerase